MENLTDSLSGSQITLYSPKNSVEDFAIVEFDETVIKEVPNDYLDEQNNSLVVQQNLVTALQQRLVSDQTAAALTVQALLSSVRATRQEREAALSAVPSNPFDRLKLEYLGSDYKSITLQDLPQPLDFKPSHVAQSIEGIRETFNKTAHSHCEYLLSNTNSITCANLGHAFAVLSSTADGDQFIIDKQKYANELKFADLMCNMTLDEVEENPIIAARKILSYYIDLHS